MSTELLLVRPSDRVLLIGLEGSLKKFENGEVVGTDMKRVEWNKKYRGPRPEDEEGPGGDSPEVE